VRSYLLHSLCNGSYGYGVIIYRAVGARWLWGLRLGGHFSKKKNKTKNKIKMVSKNNNGCNTLVVRLKKKFN